MTTKKQFIEAIKQALGREKGLSSRLSDFLHLGQESIYRRIRGDVSFTLEEAIEVARHLQISLDDLFLDNNKTKATFRLNLINMEEPANNYCDILSGYIELFEKIKDYPSTTLYSAYNTIPYTFFLNHDLCSKFHLYKWLYLINRIDYKTTLLEYEMPEKVRRTQRLLRRQNQQVNKAIYILARNIFTSFAQDIALFVELELISQQEKEELKEELFFILNSIEQMAITGSFASGNEVSVYLANINIDASYTYFESDDFVMAHLRVFSVNGIESYSSEVCKQSKAWMNALQNYSTSITKTDTFHRSRYFEEQKKLIAEILK